MEYVAMFLGVLGAWLVARKNRWGFMSWIFSNFLWIAFSIIHSHWGMLTQFTIFLVLAYYGWRNWREDEDFETNYG